MSELTQVQREGPLRTLAVAAAVCLVCSVLVSASVQLLRPRQQANRERERERQIMALVARQPALADMLATLEEVDVRARLVELATGLYADWLDPDELDPNRPDLATVYEVWRGERLELVILPVHGPGYASTMRGHLAVAADGNTVVGLAFHEHGETPGLGGEIEEPEWLAQWEGKRLRDEEGRIRIGATMDELDPNAPEAAYQVDGISGATKTTDGVTNLLRFWVGDEGFGPYLRRIAS